MEFNNNTHVNATMVRGFEMGFSVYFVQLKIYRKIKQNETDPKFYTAKCLKLDVLQCTAPILNFE